MQVQFEHAVQACRAPPPLWLPAQEADLLVLEFAVNDLPFISQTLGTPLNSTERRGFEQLLRKALRHPRAPAVLLLCSMRWSPFPQNANLSYYWCVRFALCAGWLV